MSNITAAMVKELREITGAGMMDCKKALAGAGGDLELALENLRKAGIAKAAKKAERATKEGRAATLIQDGKAAVVEISCETDFVAKTDDFGTLVQEVLAGTVALDADGDVTETVAEQQSDCLTALIGRIGENMQIRRAACWQLKGTAATYIHGNGRVGVLVEAQNCDDEQLLRDICMHVAAFRPAYIVPEDVPQEVLAKEREIAAAQVEGKPANIIDKIVMGKINKWYTETCLTRQPWIRDDKKCLAKLAPKLNVCRFLRWEVGEPLS